MTSVSITKPGLPWSIERDTDGSWHGVSGDRRFPLGEGGRAALHFLPMLEHFPEEILVTLEASEPVRHILFFALREGGAYWGNLALGWVEALSMGDAQTLLLLQHIFESRNLPQAFRHRASKLHASLRRAQSP